MRYTKTVVLIFICLLSTVAVAAQGTSRPPITGLSHLCLYTSDAAAAEHFYVHSLSAIKAPDPDNPNGVRYLLGPKQFVELLPLPANHTMSRLGCVGYATTDASALRQYLSEHKYEPLGELQKSSDGSVWFETDDPEGNHVQFMQSKAVDLPADPNSVSRHMIHAGFLVHSKIAEDRFYKELLGFRPYWFGGMKEGIVDWVSLQTPEGHDWFEYMLVGPGTTNAVAKDDRVFLGVLNHFSLGVENMEAAVTTLWRNNAISPRHDGPQMGRDGKWQTNLYDPDDVRVELMEYQPAMTPCCSPFTAENPKK